MSLDRPPELGNVGWTVPIVMKILIFPLRFTAMFHGSMVAEFT